MAIFHRSQRLQIYGERPEVTKLFGGRYRMVVRCVAAKDTEAWYNDNKSQIFADFGSLYNAQMPIDGIDPRAGEAYPNMSLVSNSAGMSGGEYLITFVYETLTTEWVKEQEDEVSSTANGLRVLKRSQVSSISTAAPYNEDDVGVSTLVIDEGTDDEKTLYLAAFEDRTRADSKNQIGRIVTQWAEAGILEVDKDFEEDGLLYVTFTSQGTKFTPTAVNGSITGDPLVVFQGGLAAPVFRDRIKNVSGFRNYIVTVMLKQDGTALASGDELQSYTEWETYKYPGYVDTDFNDGIVPVSGGNLSVKVTVTETLSTSSTAATTGTVPFSIKEGCNVYINYIPTATGIAKSLAKSFGTNFLEGSFGIGSGGNTTLFGMPVDSVVGGGGSNPTYANFLLTDSPVLQRKPIGTFTTDEGTKWYRVRQVQLIGTFGSYLT